MVTVHLVKGAFQRRRWLYGIWGFSLAAAVSGLMVIDVYRASLAGLLQAQGAKMLSAHVSISARREISPDEFARFRSSLPDGTDFSRVTEMFAMVSTAKESRLGALRFIDENYPLIGELSAESGAVKSAMEAAWASPDLIPLMDMALGDRLKVGEREFKIARFITKDSSQAFRGNSMAPRIYLPRSELPATKLIQFGSTFKDSWYARLPAAPPPDLKKKLEKLFPDPAVDVTVPADLEQGSLRVLSRILDYLGLVGLVTLALGWIGVYYLGRRWLYLSRPSVGLLKCLGFNRREVARVLLSELFLILTFGAALGGLFSWGLAHWAGPALEKALPEDFNLIWSWRNSLLLLLVGPGLGIVLLFESVWRTADAPALDLVADRATPARGWPAWLALAASLLTLSLALTFLQARSWVVTFAFLAEMLGSLILVATLAFVGLIAVNRLRHDRSAWLWHTVASQWVRRPGLTILLVSVTALSGLLTQLIPHLEKTLIGELKGGGTAADRPGVFMFDVQDDQVMPLAELLEKNGLKVSEKAPMIRARLLRVNGQDFERFEVGEFSTREQEGDARMRNRGVNLSYRESLSRSEKTLDGPDFSKLRTSPAELSVEAAYADRLGLKMGDQLQFDVQGVEVPAVVAHIRQVDWDSFEPNFFMQFRPGVLDEAPKTWVLTVKRSEVMKPPEIQRLVAVAFPNITSINIVEAIDTISGLLAKLGFGLRIASRLSLALGFFVFLMIIVFQLMSSEKDWLELHRLGMSGRELQLLQVVSFGGLALAGTLLGTALSLVVNWTLARFTFGVPAQFDYFNSTQVLAMSVVSASLALLLLSRRHFQQTQFKSRLDPL